MSFFNKKEDVLDIQLTSYGRYLLSKGKFKPAFYAFSDDEIVYDSSYMNSGSVEVGEETFNRIVNNSISTKAIYDGESAESRVSKLNGQVIRTDKQSEKATRSGKINKTPVDDIYGKDYVDDINLQPGTRGLMTNLLSNGRLGEKFVPALSVLSLKEYAKFNLPIQISSSGDSSINPGLRVPQLNIDVDYRTIEYPYDGTEYPTNFVDNQSETEKDIIFRDVLPKPGTGGVNIHRRVVIDDRMVILDFREDNILDGTEGFEVEMFIVEENSSDSQQSLLGSPGTAIRRDKEILRRVNLKAKSNQFSDDVDNIATYFDIVTDSDIPDTDLIENNGAGEDPNGPLRVPGLYELPTRNTIVTGPTSMKARRELLENIYNNFTPVVPEDEGDCD